MQTVIQLTQKISQERPELIAQYYRNTKGDLNQVSYGQFYKDFISFAIELKKLGVARESLVGLLSENCRQWAVADFAVMALGAADVPRGRDITDQEIDIIYGNTKCAVVIVERDLDLKRVLERKTNLPELKHIIVLEEEFSPAAYESESIKVHSFFDLLESGLQSYDAEKAAIEDIITQGKLEDLATIIFTSGTTGLPKGVMLTQHNYVNHAQSLPARIKVSAGEVWLTILPVWHSFERCIQYVVLCNGLSMAYSKPIGPVMLQDFKDVQPHYTTAVPRIWEAVYNSVQKKVNAAGGAKKILFNYFVAIGGAYVAMVQRVRGTIPRFKWRSRFFDALVCFIPMVLLWPGKKMGDALVFKNVKAVFGRRFKSGISGGGSLQKKIDRFFAAAGLTLLEGYGLTESGPVLSVRTEWKPEAGTVGPEFPNMDVSIRNEEGKECKPGEKGVLYAKGCQIMTGYYEDPLRTAEVLSEDGWLNTGDLAVWTHDRTFAIVGRAKDTVVLLGGENIEPVPIEKNLSSHPMIDHAVVVGQDQKYLGALLVPNFEQLEELAASEGWKYTDREDLLASHEVMEFFRSIVVEAISAKNGFKSFEQIYKFTLLKEAFQVNVELSAKQELKRHKVNEMYKKEIDSLF